ncbi:MAG: DUF1801 domain-containing protein [Acidobacteriota bacterium]
MKKSTTALPATIDEYLATIPEPARTTLTKVRAVIRSVLPPETEEVISYRIPVFKYKGMVVGFAAFKNHCSLFAMNGRVQQDFKEELKGYKTSKGTIQFPLDKPLPTALLKKLVKVRLAQNEAKKSR